MDVPRPPNFSHTLREMRLASGLSQEALAERAGLSARGISDLERGVRKTPRLETVRMLANALGLDAARRHALLTAARPRRAPATSLSSDAGLLPPIMAPLIGRDAELSTIQRLLVDGDARMVTLTGPGGVGKTTLALAAAHTLASRFGDGVTYLPLGQLIDPRLVTTRLGEALGVRAGNLPSVDAAIRRALLRQRRLLVFDNFEHLIESARLVADIIATCPGVRVIVTSRERLRVRGERVLLLDPLTTPDLGIPSTADAIARTPAVRVFLRRVQEMDPAFALTDGNAATVAAICHRLEGLPLALELAASWTRVLSPGQLLDRLDRRLPLLTKGPRDAHERHQTLGNAIAWSYQLLSPGEQRTFRWMGVFVGGFDLEAVEGIVGNGESQVDLVASLVDKSLVRRNGDDTLVRFTMLETLREFALAELDAAGEREEALARHADWYVALGERMQEHLLREVDSRWLDRLEADHGNLRNALVWTLVTSNDPASARKGLRLARAIWLFWYYRSNLAEGRWWLERALAAAGEGRDAVRAMALVGLGTLANAQGDTDTALRWLHNGLDMAREVGDRTVTAYALSVLGNQAEDSGAYETAGTRFSEANRLFTQIGDLVNVAITGYHLGVVAFGQGQLETSERRCLESLEISRGMNDTWGTAVSLAQLGLVRAYRGEVCEAASDLDMALTLFARLGTRERIADTLYRIGSIATEGGSHEAAVRLFTDAARLREEVGAALSLPERAVYEAAEQRARSAVGARSAPVDDTTRAHRTLDDIIEDAHRLLMDIADACDRRTRQHLAEESDESTEGR